MVKPARKLRVAYIDDVLNPTAPGRSGMSDTVWDMAVALEQAGHEAHVIGSYANDTYPEPVEHVHNFDPPPMAYRNVIGHALRIWRTATILDVIRPDVVHGQDYFATALLTLLRPRLKVVLTTPGNIFARIASGKSGFEWYFAQILKVSALVSARRCARVIATSSEMRRWWGRTGTLPGRMELIPLGVSQRRFQYVPHARSLLGIEDDRIVLLYVGRFSREKGILETLAILPSLLDSSSNLPIQVVLVGGGPQDEDVRRSIERLGLQDYVTVVPWVHQSQLPAYYCASDVLLLPSFSEPLGKVMLEAMACGTPVLATSTEGPSDHVVEAVNGWLFPIGDFDALRSALSRLISNVSHLRGMRHGVRESITHLGWDATMQTIIDRVYLRLADTSAICGSDDAVSRSRLTGGR